MAMKWPRLIALVAIILIAGLAAIYLYSKNVFGFPAPGGTFICGIVPSVCPALAPPAQAQTTKVSKTTNTVKPGDEVRFDITYQAQGNANGTSTYCLNGTIATGWVRVIDHLPGGLTYVSASITPTRTDCNGANGLVWAAGALEAGGQTQTLPNGQRQTQGTIALTARVSDSACTNTTGVVTIGNRSFISVHDPQGNQVKSMTSDFAYIKVDCAKPLTVTGNVSSTAGDVSASSKLVITAPSVVTAAGTVGLTCPTGVTCLSSYPIDLNQAKTLMAKITQRLLKELAGSCTFDAGNILFLNNNVCRSSGAIRIAGVSGRGTIIVGGFNDTNSRLTIGGEPNPNGSPVNSSGVGIIMDTTSTSPITITTREISGMILYAPNAIVDFGTVERTVDFKGIFIAKEFRNIANANGKIEFDSSLVRNPPPGMAQIIAPLVKEGIP